MHVNINNTIKINYINSELINNIHNFKEKIKTDDKSSRLDTHIHEVFKDKRSPPIHLLPTYVRYKIITNMNHTCNNGNAAT